MIVVNIEFSNKLAEYYLIWQCHNTKNVNEEALNTREGREWERDVKNTSPYVLMV